MRDKFCLWGQEEQQEIVIRGSTKEQLRIATQALRRIADASSAEHHVGAEDLTRWAAEALRTIGE